MSKAIAMIWGAWIMYCTMIHSYDGAIALLIMYVFNPFEFDTKKDASTGDADANHQ